MDPKIWNSIEWKKKKQIFIAPNDIGAIYLKGVRCICGGFLQIAYAPQKAYCFDQLCTFVGIER